MALSIRNKDTEAAVRRLAAHTGVGLTEAIDEAVNRRLVDLQVPDPDAAALSEAERVARMKAAVAEFMVGVNPDNFMTDDDLYDDMGLPR